MHRLLVQCIGEGDLSSPCHVNISFFFILFEIGGGERVGRHLRLGEREGRGERKREEEGGKG
jgi:hypothetical protein